MFCKVILQKISQLFRKSYLHDPLQENLCDGVLFNEIAEIKKMVGIPKNKTLFGIFSMHVQQMNLLGNLQCSKFDGDCIFLWEFFSFYDKVPSHLAGFFPKYFHSNTW